MAELRGALTRAWFSPALGERGTACEALLDWWYAQVRPERHPGAQLAVYRNERPLARLSGGVDGRGRPVQGDALFPVLSISKMLAALVVHHLHARDLFDYEQAVARHWPAFAAGGKDEITIAQLLSHRAGLAPPLLDEYRNWREWLTPSGPERLAEAARPRFPPGSRHAYHAQTWGYVVDGLVRRWTGLRTGAVLARQLGGRAGGPACFLGLPEAAAPRLAALASATFPGLGPDRPAGGEDHVMNSPALLAQGLSWGGGVASAEGLAAVLQIFARRGRLREEPLFDAEEWRALTTPRNERQPVDARLGTRVVWGLGVMLGRSEGVRGCRGPVFGRAAGPETLGHLGGNCALAWADAGTGTSLAFLSARAPPDPDYQGLSDRVRALVD